MNYVIYDRLKFLNEKQKTDLFVLLCPQLKGMRLKNLNKDAYNKLIEKYYNSIINRSKSISFLRSPPSLLVNKMDPVYSRELDCRNAW